MATELYAGSLADFDSPDPENDSMAREIEKALVDLLGPLPSAPQKLVDDRRALFIAISRGVINHLAAKQAAMQIDFNVGLVHVTTHPVVHKRD
jgi:hypothetical protein